MSSFSHSSVPGALECQSEFDFYSKSGQNHARLIIDAEAKAKDARPQDRYQLRLFFSQSKLDGDDRRVFDVYVQDKLAVSDVTIEGASGEAGDSVLVLNDILVGEELDIRFQAKQGKPLLSGLELIRQNSGEQK